MLALITKRQNKVIETLLKLKRLFGSAADLAEVVEEFGLFTGKAQLYEDGWYIHSDDERFDEPSSWATYGWAFPAFVTKVNGRIWFCRLGFGIHHLILGFRKKDGELVHIEPDDYPSNRCWEEDSFEGRIDEILNLLGIIWFPFKFNPEELKHYRTRPF